MTVDHYTTITVTEYNLLKATILDLRAKLQTAREHLESGQVEAALSLLRTEVL